jgi:hypothetical protein
MNNDNFDPNNDIKLEHLLNDLTLALEEHKEYLERHIEAMDKLTRTLKHFEVNLKGEINQEHRQSSRQLEELVKMFVEYNINPKYYRQFEHVMIESAEDLDGTGPETRRPERRTKKTS